MLQISSVSPKIKNNIVSDEAVWNHFSSSVSQQRPLILSVLACVGSYHVDMFWEEDAGPAWCFLLNLALPCVGATSVSVQSSASCSVFSYAFLSSFVNLSDEKFPGVDGITHHLYIKSIYLWDM